MPLIPHAPAERVSRRLGEAVARTHVSPNLLTLIGLAGAGAAAALAAYGHFWQAGLAMLAAALFDLLDGAVARATGAATRFGAILDATADRIAEFGILLALLVWYSGAGHFNRDAVILLGVVIAGSMLVSYTRSKAGEYGVHLREGLGTRPERVVILSIGLFADEVVAVLWLLAVLTHLTAAQRLFLAWWAIRNAPPD